MARQKEWSVDSLVSDFERHLLTAHGVTRRTCILYSGYVRDFLQTTFGKQRVEPSHLQPPHLISFITEKASRYKPKTSKLVATSLRNFLRFLQVNGDCDERLFYAVPAVHYWRQSNLPRSLSKEQVGQLLSSFDRSTARGCRNYAMVRLLTDLALRAEEVSALRLEDIDWRKGILQLSKNKTRRIDLLPLPAAVGQAIVEYLSTGRPSTKSRQVFVRHVSPVGEPLSSGAVRAVVRRASHRAEIGTAGCGTHILRHTTATRMINNGASLKEIADLLRHRDIDTTAIYAKVNLSVLSQVVMPWPEG